MLLLTKPAKRASHISVAVFAFLLAAVPACGFAQAAPDATVAGSGAETIDMFGTMSYEQSEVSPPPPVLEDLQNQQAPAEVEEGKVTLGLQIRTDAIREAALSYGARGGLAHRTFEIQRRLAEYDTSMSKAFNFQRLLISAPSGLLIEPPIITEGQRAVIVNSGGQSAAVADRIYRINRIARIVTAPRDWRLYLERDWGRVDPPATILLPKNEEEIAAWKKFVKQGWELGLKQAEETFEADIERMLNDYTGMIRYRELLAQGMVSPPYATADDRGVTGGGSEMRIGDRGVAIMGQSSLISQSNVWTPVSR